jgi:hypothetical protein
LARLAKDWCKICLNNVKQSGRATGNALAYGLKEK